MSDCRQLLDMASAGAAPALRAVDCVAGETTAAAFDRLFGAQGALAPVLTICLTLYIAFFAVSLLTGRSALSISALTPRMLTLGLVLTFATSWIAYQGIFWNLAVAAPDWIASVLMGTANGSGGSATQLFADRIDIVFAAIGQAAQGGGEAGQGGGQEAAGGAAGMFQPADVMWLGALLLLLGTVGVLLTARIALAVLLALGPVFVVMALFAGTRGLTAGWLRGVALTALTPLLVVLGGGITLELLVPVLAALAESGIEGVSGRAALALFLIASVHVALMAMVMKVALTMVAGWQVFGLAASERGTSGSGASWSAPGWAAAPAAAAAAPAPLQSARRGAVVTSASGTGEVHAPAPAGGSEHPSGRRVVVTQVMGGGIAPLAAPGPSRARGLGSRFRNANDSGRPKLPSGPAKEMIK